MGCWLGICIVLRCDGIRRYRRWYLYHAAQVPSLLTMHGPTGCSGVQAVPNRAQFAGSVLP